jgi:hypothetical protein
MKRKFHSIRTISNERERESERAKERERERDDAINPEIIFMSLFIARIWISNAICRGLFTIIFSELR